MNVDYSVVVISFRIPGGYKFQMLAEMDIQCILFEMYGEIYRNSKRVFYFK